MCSIFSVFFSSKCSLFHNANFFGSCIIHILYTGCAELKKNNSGAKGLKYYPPQLLFIDKTNPFKIKSFLLLKTK